uniref:G-protein coupled receptors family 1 profile domain-containing protein n=1 Tax=Catagonus wagneri TaxID=51154 RepID=A0A8C3W5F1_9CETA
MSGLPLDIDLHRVQMKNVTEVTMFILIGFTDNFDLQVFLFFLLLAIYLFTLIGNLRLVLLVIIDSRLYNPMYYFLSALSFLDACYSSVITPKLLVNFMSENKTISYLGCAAQMFLFITFGTTECFILAAMAYDHHEAMYKPLLYSVRMSPRVYVPLIILRYIGGILHSALHTVATFSLSFCASNEIRHVFCDIPPLLALSCTETHTNQLRMHSAEGRRKVFSTCGSHLTGVSIFHGTVLFMYVRPNSIYALDHDMIVSVSYTIVIPMLNPIIYSMRNKDVKVAVKRTDVYCPHIKKL